MKQKNKNVPRRTLKPCENLTEERKKRRAENGKFDNYRK